MPNTFNIVMSSLRAFLLGLTRFYLKKYQLLIKKAKHAYELAFSLPDISSISQNEKALHFVLKVRLRCRLFWRYRESRPASTSRWSQSYISVPARRRGRKQCHSQLGCQLCRVDIARLCCVLLWHFVCESCGPARQRAGDPTLGFLGRLNCLAICAAMNISTEFTVNQSCFYSVLSLWGAHGVPFGVFMDSPEGIFMWRSSTIRMHRHARRAVESNCEFDAVALRERSVYDGTCSKGFRSLFSEACTCYGRCGTAQFLQR